MIEGILRSELAALLSGGLCIFLSLYTAAGSALITARVKRRLYLSAGELNISVPSAGVFPQEVIEGSLSVPLPARIFPGFPLTAQLTFSFAGRWPLIAESPLVPGQGKTQWSIRTLKRGIYSLSDSAVCIRDVLGLTESSVSLDLSERLVVFPDIDRPGGISPPEYEGGTTSVQGDRIRRSEELIETRKYYPGDDVRRLSWKLYAHSGELFLKIGEETPPPHSRLLVIIESGVDTEGRLASYLASGSKRQPYSPIELLSDYLDELVVSATDFSLSALERGMDVVLSYNGLSSPLRFSPGMERELLSACAGVQVQPSTTREGGQHRLPPLPEESGFHACVFSFPVSPHLPELITGCETHQYPVRIFFKRVKEVQRSRGLRLADLLLEDTGAGRKRERDDEALNALLAERISDEVECYAQRGYETGAI